MPEVPSKSKSTELVLGPWQQLIVLDLDIFHKQKITE